MGLGMQTPITAQEHGQKLFLMSAEQAAEPIANGLIRDKAIIAFPRGFTFLTRIGAPLPERIQRLPHAAFDLRSPNATEWQAAGVSEESRKKADASARKRI